MTADRTAAKYRRILALAGAAGIALAGSACSSSGSSGGAASGGERLSYDRVASTAKQLTSTSACPFGLDPAAALKAAGAERTVTPAASGGDPAARGTVDPGRPAQALPSGQPTPSGLPSFPAVPPNASVVCNFTASDAPMKIDLVAVSEGEVAVNLALPQIARLGDLSADEVMTFSRDEPGIGQTRVTPGRGTAAVARVAVAGKGDLALVVSQGWPVTKADPALAGESLRKVAEALAAQLRP
ncbi:hypothetical protein ACFWP2_10495 [Kitasatospora sp. NPDC058444]|uniref:hypothetical protein n=1 Tax=Kitasatospora sp. NPDC058444 TaxID=3346504 RepID=UPI00365A103A